MSYHKALEERLKDSDEWTMCSSGVQIMEDIIRCAFKRSDSSFRLVEMDLEQDDIVETFLGELDK